MKAKLYDTIQTLIDVPADFDERIIPKNTQGTIVECYEDPEGYAVDLAIPNSHLVGGFEYENVVLTPEQFMVISYVNSVEKTSSSWDLGTNSVECDVKDGAINHDRYLYNS